jgi:hypothetical protein
LFYCFLCIDVQLFAFLSWTQGAKKLKAKILSPEILCFLTPLLYPTLNLNKDECISPDFKISWSVLLLQLLGPTGKKMYYQRYVYCPYTSNAEDLLDWLPENEGK